MGQEAGFTAGREGQVEAGVGAHTGDRVGMTSLTSPLVLLASVEEVKGRREGKGTASVAGVGVAGAVGGGGRTVVSSLMLPADVALVARPFRLPLPLIWPPLPPLLMVPLVSMSACVAWGVDGGGVV